MSILFELERMERLAEDLDRLRRPVRIPVSCYKRMEGKEKGSPWCSTLDWEDCSIEEPWACLDSQGGTGQRLRYRHIWTGPMWNS